MNRTEFLQRVAKEGWCAYDLSPSWIKIAQQSNPLPAIHGVINLMHQIDIIITPESQINLMLPTRFLNMCPGRAEQLRHFRVIAIDWEDAWRLVKELYGEIVMFSQPFEDVVVLTISAKRLIPDDFTFYTRYRGLNPPEWNPVEFTPG